MNITCKKNLKIHEADFSNQPAWASLSQVCIILTDYLNVMILAHWLRPCICFAYHKYM